MPRAAATATSADGARARTSTFGLAAARCRAGSGCVDTVAAAVGLLGVVQAVPVDVVCELWRDLMRTNNKRDGRGEERRHGGTRRLRDNQ